MASSSTFCRYFTTGASSMSVAPLSSCFGAPSPSASSRSISMSSPTSSSSVSAALSLAFSSSLPSLSSSTTTGSTTMLVWNLISSKAWALVGSDIATNSRVPRLYSPSTRRSCINLPGNRPSGICSMSTALRSSNGKPKVCEANSATSGAFILRERMSCDTKPTPDILAWLWIASASCSISLPCCTRVRASALRLIVFVAATICVRGYP